MAQENIFAAHMWSWPDPVLQRDMLGRIIFVNTAFLNVYGDTAQNWHGHRIADWPNPDPTAGINRFETRFVACEPSVEIIYDWLEYILPDGLALAIARDVTALQSLTSVPAPLTPVPESVPVAPPDPVETISASSTPDPMSEPDQSPMLQEPPEPHARKTDTPKSPKRVLPIENTSPIINHNWRNSVIAKPLDEDTQTPAKQPMPSSSTESRQSPHTGMRILLAEDNTINALLTRTLLEEDGCEVDVVQDGKLAIDAVQNKPYDLILMDMRMPNVDGLEATETIRNLDTLCRNIPIIALTANAFDDDRQICFASGMNDFLSKPVTQGQLTQILQKWDKRAHPTAS